jgi:lipopolysaccharide biosynthesis protein
MRWDIFWLNVARRLLRRGPYSRPRLLRRDKVIIVPVAEELPRAGPVRLGVVLHVYFTEYADVFRAACDSIDDPCDILVTTDSEAKAIVIRAAFSDWPHGEVFVTVTPNRGRDMPSKFVTYADRLAQYDLVLFLHSKRSEHFRDGRSDWGQTLVATLLGSKAIVNSILGLFAARPDLGLAFPDHYDDIRRWVGWGNNRRHAGALAERMGLDLNSARALEFPSGSMFWARPAALKPLLDLGLTYDDFPDELGQLDETIAHGLERMILFSAEAAGYRWIKLVKPDLYADRGNRIEVTNATLDASIAAAGASLLAPKA